ncbi:ATP-binding protein [Myxococcota bacterium]|nr:ATP-binding protein [Myxococcota bacterium]
MNRGTRGGLDPRYRDLYLAEGTRLLDQAEEAALALDSTAGDAERVRALYRALHTVKGMAATAGDEGVRAGIQALEDLVEPLRRGGAPASGSAVDAIVLGLARARDRLREGGGAEPGHVPAPEPEVEPAVALELSGVVERLLDMRDGLLDLGHRQWSPDVDEAVAGLDGCVRRLQRLVAGSRLAPLRPTLLALRRHALGIARRAGVRVEVEVADEDGAVRADREVIEPLAALLTHLVTNAVSHGIEDPAERLAAGKPEAGRVLLSAERDRDHVRIVVLDDGRGFDAGGIGAAAVAAGLLGPEGAARLTPGDAAEICAAAGLSTARAALAGDAGRGIGLSAVRVGVEALGGRLALETERGTGTRLTVEVPYSATLRHLLLVRAGGVLAGLPMRSVRRTFVPAASDPHPPSPGIPLATLLDRETEGATGGIGVVLDGARGSFAVTVDDVVGALECVVSRPSFPLDRIPLVAGTTPYGRNHVAFVLDVGLLAARAERASVARGL